MAAVQTKTSARERAVLRDLASRVRQIAEDPSMAVRKQRWQRHNALQGEGPMILCNPEGAWNEIFPDSALVCQSEPLRGWEWTLRSRIFWWEHIRDDSYIDPWLDINWKVDVGDFGVQISTTHGDNRGSYTWKAPLEDLERDLPKLHFRSLSVDRETTEHSIGLANEILGDILPVRIRSYLWWSMGLTDEASKLVGLENLMLLMYDQPDELHRLMAFLRDERLHFISWCEREGLVSPNNGPDPIASGGIGATDELHPASDSGVALGDIWGFAESQETVGVSPSMFKEFVLPYQVPIMERFGLNSYGCCEGLEHRIDAVTSQIPRLRRVSVAPTANQEILADKLAENYIFSRKPNPAHVSVGFNEKAIREDLRHTLAVAGKLPLEIILKDTHTIENDPARLTRWVQIAREEVGMALA
ncbi:MAG: hypothetical protein WCO94_05370 [Verrucomicrobiota bacterium]